MAAAGAAAATAALGLAPALAAPSAGITIPVACSPGALVRAITRAPSGATLLLHNACTYLLASGLPTITKTLTFNGPSSIARNTRTGIPQFSIMTVGSGGNVTLNNVNFSGGNSAGNGGAIYNNGGSVTVSGGTFRQNNAAGNGGAIYSAGSLSVTNATFSGNTADFGGAMEIHGSGTITHCQFLNNSVRNFGGAINNYGTTLVDDSSFSGGRANYGGGVDNNGSGSFTIQHSKFTSNTAVSGGGVSNAASMVLHDDLITGNGNTITGRGGGVFTLTGMTVSDSTISGNQAIQGGGFYGTNSYKSTLNEDTI
ncbi:MAG TPA: hypothetical protein VMA95_13985, partial [Streptosporangiaceae bacterium]|nr:hypothetical protein [Streptosporangiaceae bacterium]